MTDEGEAGWTFEVSLLIGRVLERVESGEPTWSAAAAVLAARGLTGESAFLATAGLAELAAQWQAFVLDGGTELIVGPCRALAVARAVELGYGDNEIAHEQPPATGLMN